MVFSLVLLDLLCYFRPFSYLYITELAFLMFREWHIEIGMDKPFWYTPRFGPKIDCQWFNFLFMFSNFSLILLSFFLVFMSFVKFMPRCSMGMDNVYLCNGTVVEFHICLDLYLRPMPWRSLVIVVSKIFHLLFLNQSPVEKSNLPFVLCKMKTYPCV